MVELWMQTYTGIVFNPVDPREEDVRLADIGHALANICRFNGHCRKFYSVAQHSLFVAELLMDTRLILNVNSASQGKAFCAALLHDAAEAYLGDIIRPLKPVFDGFKVTESHLLRCIHRAFGLIVSTDVESTIKHCDAVALATEARDLMGPPPRSWESLVEPSPTRIRPLPPKIAEDAWLKAWDSGIRVQQEGATEWSNKTYISARASGPSCRQ